MMRRTAATTALIGLAATGVTGCGSSDSDSEAKKGKETTITVLAAASLTDAFTTIAKQVEKDHPGTKVKLSFAASSTLVTQLNNGFDADIVALADEKSAESLKADVTKGAPHELIASNRLQIVTPTKNPGKVSSIDDLAKARTVLCAAQVPCGRAAGKALDKAKVKPNVISYEANVKATLAKVTLGEADAAIVYVTDAKAVAGKVHPVDIDNADNVITHLPLYRLQDSEGAKQFYAAVTDAAGQKVLTDAGFGKP